MDFFFSKMWWCWVVLSGISASPFLKRFCPATRQIATQKNFWKNFSKLKSCNIFTPTILPTLRGFFPCAQKENTRNQRGSILGIQLFKFDKPPNWTINSYGLRWMVSLLKHHKMKRLKEPPPFQVPESEFCWHLKRCPKMHSYSKLSWTSLWGFKMNLKFTLFFCWCLLVWTEGPESMERGHGQLRMMSPQASSPPSPSAMSRGRGFASWCFCPKQKIKVV